MSNLLVDDFNRADTTASPTGLGAISSDPLVSWEALRGDWRISSNRANTTLSHSSSPIAVIDAGLPDVDVSVDASTGGGDCLYFRVADADNWWRLRANTYPTSYQTVNVGAWGVWVGNWHASCPPTGPSDYVYGYHTKETTCTPDDTQGGGFTVRVRTRSVTLQTINSTAYQLLLERCVAGTVTTVATSGTSSSKLRVKASGDSIIAYRWTGSTWSSIAAQTNETHQNATKHGIGRGASSYSGTALDNFSLSLLIPPNPVAGSVTPASGATVTTDVPVLGVTLDVDVNGATQKAQWQIALDSGFTSGVRTITEPDVDLRASGPTTEAVPTAQALVQGTWHIRARAVGAGAQVASPAWTDSHSFTVSHPPGTAGHYPADEATTEWRLLGSSFSWTTTDTSPLDSQTAYQVIIERNSDGFEVADTGKIPSEESQALVAIPEAYKDVLLRWKVRAWDRDDVVGPYSADNLFKVSDPPGISFTSPANDDVVTSPAPTVSWSYSGNTTQKSFRVLFVDRTNGNTVHDSGWTSGNATSYSPPVVFANNGSYRIELRVRDQGDLENSLSINVTSEWIAPAAPQVVEITDLHETLGYVQIQWGDWWDDLELLWWDLYRRRAGTTDWTLVERIDQRQENYVVHDYFVTGNQDHEYAAVQTATRFGQDVQGPYEVHPISVVSRGYWLIFGQGDPRNFRLSNVTADSFSEEWEESEMTLLGQGRHVDFGQRHGVRGSLTMQLYGDSNTGRTARDQRLLLDAVKNSGDLVYLRTPFGDLFKVDIQNYTVDRMAGVGLNEYVTVTVPYVEVTT